MYAELTNALDASSKVAYAPVYETLNEPNDYLKVFPEDYALDIINAQTAWDVTTGNSDIVLAISDQIILRTTMSLLVSMFITMQPIPLHRRMVQLLQ